MWVTQHMLLLSEDSGKRLFTRHSLEEDLYNPYPLTLDICCHSIATVYTVACCIHTLSP